MTELVDGEGPIKLVVWDLDNTMWSGTLAEGDELTLRPAARDAVVELDRLGVLQSVASRNDRQDALAVLVRFGLDLYILNRRIDWQAKSGGVTDIAQALNLSVAHTAFVDDDPFERAEVAAHHPSVRCYDAQDISRLLADCRAGAETVTAESASRRALYQAEQQRAASERDSGDPEDFERSLGLEVSIDTARPGDLERIEELTRRTSQLNASGYVYPPDELARLMASPDHHVLCVAARDRFGDYGKVGAVLIDRRGGRWVLQLLIVSCRVLSRGIGTIVFAELCRRAFGMGVPLQAHYRPTDRNRAMLIALRFAGFAKVGDLPDGGMLLERAATTLPAFPDHMRLRAQW